VVIRILGCHGSELITTDSQGNRHHCHACGFLVDETCMVDGGSISGGLLEVEQDKIRHVLLSHAHFDHIKGVPLLADNMVGRTGTAPINVWGLPEVLLAFRQNILNDEIYPDFTRLPTIETAPLLCQPFSEEKPIPLDGLEAMAVRVHHTVPAVGFVVRDSASAFLYSGDTAETRRIWEVARDERRLKAAFIEASFPNELRELAQVSGHLTPELLKAEIIKLGRPDIPLYIYHLKPSYRDQIKAELRALGLPNLHIPEEGQVIVL
jgi:ribonuclease BN (tRNA processing enzyme)